jgi:hypothetical protein
MSLMITTTAEVVVLVGMLRVLIVKRQRVEHRSVRPLRVRS